MILAQAVDPRRQSRHSGVRRCFEREMGVRPLLELEGGTLQSYLQIACGLKFAKSVAAGGFVSGIQPAELKIPTPSFSP